MSKDYKARPASRARSGGSGLLTGLFIGFLLGLGTAAAIAIYVFKTPVPFASDKSARAPEKPAAASPNLKDAPKSAKTDDGKPRFDFYRILPGQEEPVTNEQLRQAAAKERADKAAEKSKSDAPTGPRDLYFLQAGAFPNPADADNLKAKLALLGMEAAVEPTTIPDKGTWYRVRLGPYSAIDDINKTRSQLAQNGIEASLVKVKDARNP